MHTAMCIPTRNYTKTADPAYKLIGHGYCADWKYLPEGAYPPHLPSTSLLYSTDKITECMNRCLAVSKTTAQYSPAGFYVDADLKCACSSSGCASQTESPDYKSYRIEQNKTGWSRAHIPDTWCFRYSKGSSAQNTCYMVQVPWAESLSFDLSVDRYYYLNIIW